MATDNASKINSSRSLIKYHCIPAAMLQSVSHMARRVSLFVTCIVDQLFPKVGMAMAEVLEGIGYEVDFPEAQTCCGQPAFNSGFRGHLPERTEESRSLAGGLPESVGILELPDGGGESGGRRRRAQRSGDVSR